MTLDGVPERIVSLLAEDAEDLLGHRCETIPRERIHVTGPNVINEVWSASDRSPQVLRSIGQLFGTGRLANTGYVSILPVDQGIEESAGSSFSPNPIYFDPAGVMELATEAGCSAIMSSVGALGSVARRYAHRIPFIVKLNHSECLTHPASPDHVFFGGVRQAWDMGAVAVGASVRFGSANSRSELVAVSRVFEEAHRLGMATVLWCYVGGQHFLGEVDHHFGADVTGQANHLGVSIAADLIMQKLPRTGAPYPALQLNRHSRLVYDRLLSGHPIDQARYQVANAFMGRVGMVSAGGASGDADFEDAVRTAVLNKRAGGVGTLSGRKAFQRPMAEGIALLNLVQDVYLSEAITVS